jgi:hypothetical protein
MAGSADLSGLWAIVILVLVIMASLYLFFEVLGFSATDGKTSSDSSH